MGAKRRFKDLRAQLGFEVSGATDPKVGFIQKVNVVLDKMRLRLIYPFNHTYVQTTDKDLPLILHPARKLESQRRMRKRIEKAVMKREAEGE